MHRLICALELAEIYFDSSLHFSINGYNNQTQSKGVVINTYFEYLNCDAGNYK